MPKDETVRHQALLQDLYGHREAALTLKQESEIVLAVLLKVYPGCSVELEKQEGTGNNWVGYCISVGKG